MKLRLPWWTGNKYVISPLGSALCPRSHLIYPLTTRVVGTPRMISQPVSSIFPCSPLPSETWRTPSLSIRWYCLPTSFSVCLVFSPPPLSLGFARWFWPDLMNGRRDHTTAVCASLWWPGGLRVILVFHKELNLFSDSTHTCTYRLIVLFSCGIIWSGSRCL